MQNINNNDNTGKSGWDDINSSYTDWGNSASDYPQNDYTEQGWGNSYNNQHNYSQQNYNYDTHAKTTDFQKYCSGSFNDYNCFGRKNKSSLTKTYVNNSYFSSGYIVPCFDNSNTYTPTIIQKQKRARCKKTG